MLTGDWKEKPNLHANQPVRNRNFSDFQFITKVISKGKLRRYSLFAPQECLKSVFAPNVYFSCLLFSIKIQVSLLSFLGRLYRHPEN